MKRTPPSGQCNRRQFQQALALLPLTASALASQAAAKPRERVPVVDTHLHCFAGAEDQRFPYHKNAPYRPAAAATPEHLLRCMDEAGVDFAVVVHPEPYQDDHRYLEHCLSVGGGRLKGTLLLFCDQPASMKQLPDLVRRLSVVTLRMHAYAPGRLPPFGKPELKAFWRAAAEHGLAIQLHLEPRYARHFGPLIEEFADTKVVIDHLGRPMQGTPAEHEEIVRWSEFPNTIIKLAAIPSQNSYPHRDVGPVIRRLADHYGADRMIYGGGFNAGATGKSYRAAFESARQYLAHLSPAEQQQVFGGVAARLYKFN